MTWLLLLVAGVLARLSRVCGWILRRQPGTVVRPEVLTPTLGCEVCEQRDATVGVPSQLEEREVFMCDWCYRRWRRANEVRAIPRTRKPKSKRGGRGGAAA